MIQSVNIMPTLFRPTTFDVAREAVSANFVFHPSVWYQEVAANKRSHKLSPPGPESYLVALTNWLTAYPESKIEQLETACDPKTQEAFSFFVCALKNTGPFLKQNPTNKTSRIAGVYRHRMDSEGVSHAWLFRSGTAEERRQLVRPEFTKVDGHAFDQWSFYPGAWTPDAKAHDAAMAAVSIWTHEVCSQGNMKALKPIVAEDVKLFDGVGLSSHPAPVIGRFALEEVLRKRAESYTLGGMVPLAVVAPKGSHKVWLHWSQALVCRQTGATSTVDGITIFVFDHSAKMYQIVEFRNPTSEEKAAVFREAHLMRI